ncbi:MAG: DUF4962 domain-containing protein [Treponema sp.]|jgi:hypothetical protein|nr:DUF4962 domain-containing protein [Treponema sp.]
MKNEPSVPKGGELNPAAHQGAAKQKGSAEKTLHPRDFAVVILCLAGTAVSLNLFRLDLFQTIRHLTESSVGTITFKYNTAQRRLATRVIWDRLQNGSPVYNGDLIRTADLSEAVIHILAGDNIVLQENTLIQIKVLENGETEIDLSSGELNLEAPPPAGGGNRPGIILNAAGGRIEVASGTVMSASSGDEGLVLQVTEGSAVFDSPEGSREAAAGTVIALDASGTERTRAGALVYTPQRNARFLNPRQEPLEIPFSWNRINLPAGEPLRLEIAGDQNFTRISQAIDAPGSAVRAALSPGTWYWRITRERGRESLASGRFKVIYAPAPAPISPPQGYVYRYRTRTPALHFQWTETEGAPQYEVEAADNPNFINPHMSLRVRGTSLNSSAMGAGTWYWRVRPVFPGDQGGEISAASFFRIEQTSSLEVPELISPETGSMINMTGDRDIYFSWRKENEAASYTIRISGSQDLRNPVVNQTVRNNYFSHKKGDRPLKAGQYYWAVFQTDFEGNQSPVSAVRTFTALAGEAAQYPVYPPDNYAIAEALLPELRFTWKSNLPHETRFQISQDANFSRLQINQRVQGESVPGPSLPPGTWHWRIASVSSSGQDLYSQTRRFTIAPPLPAPAAEIPPPGGKTVIRGRESLEFRWRPVNGAEYYQFKVYTGDSRSRVVYEQIVRTRNLQIPSPDMFSDGSYYWTLQAFADEGTAATRRVGLVGREQFFLRRVRPLSLEAPGMGAEIPGLTALRETTVIRWTAPETLRNSRFVLSRNANPLEGTPVLEIPNPGQTITLNRLDEGAYYWIVTGETPDGFDISPVAPRRFRVLPIALLPEVVLRQPANAHVITMEELRQRRNVVFTWDAAEGATGYILTLFQRIGSGKRQIMQTGPQSLPSLTLENLRLLDRGDFIWQVEAVSGTNGVIEQRGRIAENTFTLDIPLPEKVQTGKTGILYGK